MIHYRSQSDDALEHLAEISTGVSYFDSDGKIIQYMMTKVFIASLTVIKIWSLMR